ncbi:MAG: hypothetical protein AAGF20_00725 [Pseudomonadota bacterium]
MIVEAAEAERAAACEALEPGSLSADEYDALPPWAQQYFASGAAAWIAYCA